MKQSNLGRCFVPFKVRFKEFFFFLILTFLSFSQAQTNVVLARFTKTAFLK